MNIAEQRLYSQRLQGSPLASAVEVVRWLGAVQAQDYPAAKWGVAQRMTSGTDAMLDAAFNGGEIIRTHVLRPTWHFVAPEDLRWMLALTSPRVHMANRGSYRRLELDPALLRKACKIITQSLEGGRYRTRGEIGEALGRKKIVCTALRLSHIMMYAELEGLVCSGPLRGRQHTYALVDERVPPAPARPREEALAELARRYFASHGPATAHDFAWWSGLTVTDARRAVQSLGDALEATTIDGRTYWWAGPPAPANRREPRVHLLPNFDEHVVAYRDHGPSVDPRTPQVLADWWNTMGTHPFVLNGLIIGGWKRSVASDRVTLELVLHTDLRAWEREKLKEAVRRYGDFLGRPVTIN